MLELSTPLALNFTLREFLRSETAERNEDLKREQQNPPHGIIENLRYQAESTIQPIRSRIGYPIHINSGYRCTILNKLVEGSATSQHCRDR